MSVEITWRGDAVKKKVREATKRGIDKTMAAAVIHAKQNHPGWSNRTGAAEGSVRVIVFAEERGNAVVGIWGSTGVNYVIWLEFKNGSFLRTAADAQYPKLAANIREAMG